MSPGRPSPRRVNARRRSWTRRRVVVAAVAALVAMLAGGLTGVQIRAAQAEDRRTTAQAQAAADHEAAAAEERLVAAQAALVADWTDGVGQAQERLVAAAQTLATSEGKVADDAVRTTLAQAIAQVTALVDAAPDSADLTDEAVAQLTAAVATLDQAVAAVTEAQAAWQAEQDALAAQQAAAPPPRTSGRSGGAGADCGGQGSYEPSSGGGGGAVFYTSTPAVDGNGTNGRMPRSAMTALPWCVDSQGNQQWLRSDAAEALIRMNEAFRAEFGENIAVDLTYRSYDDQVAMREAYGSGAAEPGTSNHGQGTAFDTWEWAAYSFGTPRYDWLVTTGRQYGWVSPVWAREDGSSPEYWHYEYTG